MICRIKEGGKMSWYVKGIKFTEEGVARLNCEERRNNRICLMLVSKIT